MKNKLFLTSMLAVMIACPVYADLFNDPDASHQSGQIASNSTVENCDANPLTYQGTTENYGTYTLTAQWTPKTCEVYYNATTHSETPDATINNTATYDSPYSMPSNVSTVSAPKTGYTFAGWTTDSTPSVSRTGDTAGTVANPWTWTDGNDWNSVTCPTLYAAYIANRCTLTYNATAHSATPAATTNNTATYDSPYSMPNDVSTVSAPATGYTFAGWTTDSDPTFADDTFDTLDNEWTWTNGSDWNSETCPTLYAAYKPNEYTVLYSAGTGCSSASGPDTATYGLQYYIKTFSEARISALPGYSVPEEGGVWTATWINGSENTPGTVGAATYTPGDNIYYYIPGVLNLGVECVPNTYTVEYRCVSGDVEGRLTLPSGKNNPDSVTYHTPYTFWDLNVCSADGQTNQEWNCVAESTGTPINQDANTTSWATADNVICTAVYSADMVNLIWKYGNGTEDTQDQCNYGAGNITIPTAPTKTGYTFTGWKVTGWTESDGE